MPLSFLPIGILLVVAVLFPVAMAAVTHALGPKAATRVKSEAYECGVPAVGGHTPGQAVKFYRVALLFLLVDVEAALLFPWAVLFRETAAEWGPWFVGIEFFLFVVILFIGYVYVWRQGAFEWD